MSDQEKFLQILFQPGETTCFAATATGTSVSHAPKQGDVFVCTNSLHPYKDFAPTQEWHRTDKPRRADVNVVSLRNFVLELDHGTLEEQYALVMGRVPVSACTFSGAKSLHFIISLQEPLATLSQYKHMAARLLKLVPEADPSCRNASRLTRLPGATRPETGMPQKSMYLGGRISREELECRLPAVEQYVVRPRTEAEVRSYVSPLIVQASQNPDEFMAERGIQSRNLLFYYIGQRFNDVGMEAERREWYVNTMYTNLKNTDDFSLSEALLAARVKGH